MYDYDYPTNSYSAPTHLFLFFLFLESTGHHNLDDKAAYHLPRNRHWLFDLVQLLAHQELFAPTFNFVIQHLLSRILLQKRSFRVTVYFVTK